MILKVCDHGNFTNKTVIESINLYNTCMEERMIFLSKQEREWIEQKIDEILEQDEDRLNLRR